MAQYGVVLSGVTAGVLAYQKGVFDSLLSSSSRSQPDQSAVPSQEKKLSEADKRKDTVTAAPQYEGLHYYETLVTCPRF